ncbi:EAL domain-containing protein [Ruminococcus sp. OA3]|uniref:bifunctional diguanylate cyclase/phosphodiesterase n=1 Tax=Ruminococcus sp. OA3 TaxID=2914164 RepID=UPI001F061A24|nr:EAL domain-containing protein [Ruminococcus sp. OA3]MCH1984112.1 EAL domain-containing protein [Ruminococcus sp. OA3]
MKKNKLLNKNTKNMAVPILLCLCFIACSLVFLIQMIHKNEQENINYIYSSAQQNKISIDKQIEGDFQTLEGISLGMKYLGVTDSQQIMQMLRGINDKNAFIRMGYANLEGTVTLVDIGGQCHEIDLSDEVFFQKALEGKETISDTFQDPFNKDAYVNYYAVPVKNEAGKVRGVLCAVHATEVFRNIIDAPVYNGYGYSDIIKSDGSYILRSRQSMITGSDSVSEKRIPDEIRIKLEKLNKLNTEDAFQFTDSEGTAHNAVIIPISEANWYLLSIVPVKVLRNKYINTAGGIMLMIVVACGLFVFFLVRQRRMMTQNHAELMRLAYKDTLADILNFAGFKMKTSPLLKEDRKTHYILWYCDLKKFKFLNDYLGYEEGDRILVQMAAFFVTQDRHNTISCRVAADNFAGIRPFQGKEELHQWFLQLLDWTRKSENETGSQSLVELCMGIYHLEEKDRGLSVDVLMNYANMAHKTAKQMPGSNYVFYTDDIRAQALEETALEARASTAFKNEEFVVYMQPKIGIQNGDRIAGAEALVRWVSAERGTIPPGRFIPLFEKSERIVELDRYVFRKVCRWIQEYVRAGNEPINIAVNVSRSGILQKDFVDYYAEVKAEYNVPDGVLELEFTESILLNDNELFLDIVCKLQERGFICSLDDFGSGYSSLNLLKDLPFNVLKLDILFFQKSKNRERERIVISNFIHMAQELQIKTIAEGVELPDTVSFLREAGCDVIQGFVFARPMPLGDFERMLSEMKDKPFRIKAGDKI